VVLLRVEGGTKVLRRTVCNFLSLECELMSFVGEDRLRLMAVAMGNGTNSGPVLERLRLVIGEQVPVAEIDETDSTLEARKLFYEEFPPGFLLRLLPPGLWPEPDIPLDGYAAEVLGRRFLEARVPPASALEVEPVLLEQEVPAEEEPEIVEEAAAPVAAAPVEQPEISEDVVAPVEKPAESEDSVPPRRSGGKSNRSGRRNKSNRSGNQKNKGP
jgi:hypothetical protein